MQRLTFEDPDKGSGMTIEQHGTDVRGQLIDARINCSKGHVHTIEIHMLYLSTWRFWRWIKVINRDNDMVAYAWWPLPWLPPGLLKWTLTRALDRVHPEVKHGQHT